MIRKSICNLTFPEKITSDALVDVFWNPSRAFIFTVYYFFLENGIRVYIKMFIKIAIRAGVIA